jgi:hypothetical protein
MNEKKDTRQSSPFNSVTQPELQPRFSRQKLLGWLGTFMAIAFAWGFSTWVRLDWVKQAERRPEVQWQGRFLPTTHDSYYYASMIKYSSEQDANLNLLRSQFRPKAYGAINIIGSAIVKHTGVHLDDLVTYMSVFTAGLLALPMVLLGRLYGSTLAGFFAALLAVVASGYLSRTMVGYFDTDMFSVTIPTLTLYCLLRAHRRESLWALLAGALLVFIFPFFYQSGFAVTAALCVSFIGYRWLEWLLARKTVQAESKFFTFASTLLLCIAIRFSPKTIQFFHPIEPFLGLGILLGGFGALWWIKRAHCEKSIRILQYASVLGLCFVLVFSNALGTIYEKTRMYWPELEESQTQESSLTAKELSFQNVRQTIAEAIDSSWLIVAERISGSATGCIVALMGYLLLVCIHREFIVALPFVGIGIFAHWGGERFAMHATPIAALSAVFLPYSVVELTRRLMERAKKSVPSSLQWPARLKSYRAKFGHWLYAMGGTRLAMALLAYTLIVPNLQMAEYLSAHQPTVLQNSEVQLLEDLRKASKPGDYVHTWWDWGGAVRYHTDREVLTSPGAAGKAVYIFAKMMSTDSPRLSNHLGLMAAEFSDQENNFLDWLFVDKTLTPDQALSALKENIYGRGFRLREDLIRLSQNSGIPINTDRNVFLFLPDRLFEYYPTLTLFSERNLQTGETQPQQKLFLFQKCKKSGNALWLYLKPESKEPAYIIDFAQLIISDYQQRITPAEAKKLMLAKGDEFWKVDAFTLHTKKGVLFHAKPLSFMGDKFEAKLIDGRTLKGSLNDVQHLFPSSFLKKAENLDNMTTYDVEDEQPNSTGLHVIFSLNSSYAVVADNKAYNSQFVQLVVLQRPHPEYFELISANTAGKVYKLKKQDGRN